MGTEENIIQNSVKDLLSAYGITHWRNNQVPVKGRAFIGEPGAADLFALLPPNGRFWAIECKTKKGTQSDKQIKFQCKVESAGGIYTLARNIESVEAILKQIRRTK